MNNNNFFKNLLLHIKYPYTALIIATIWIGTATIIGLQSSPDIDTLIIVTSIASLIIAVIGFSSPKQ